MKLQSLAATSLLLAAPAVAQVGTSAMPQGNGGAFQRLSTFQVFQNTDIDDETVAEIVSYADNGNLLVYTDSQTENLGFVDITDPSNPVAAGVVALPGEPTSVSCVGPYALVCVNTSADYVNTSGDLVVVNVFTHAVEAILPLGGQPDSIAISPDQHYAAICIENERDEDLGDGEPPQLPAGFLVIVDLVGGPAAWTTRNVDLTGIADLFPEDPEPEFVAINQLNVAAVTLQENNHCVLVWLPTGTVIHDFSFGTVDLTGIDTNENDLIEQNASLDAVPREPDAITWTSLFTLATADEGDLFGGSRGFTTWTWLGQPLYQPGAFVDQLCARIGHYPEDRSENKGSEPEAVLMARYGNQRYLFVGCERANVVLVFRMYGGLLFGNLFPEFVQVLPTSVGPEGIVAIPERDLFVVACEVDSRDDLIRGSLMIYGRTGTSDYPEIVSVDRPDGSPIPWAALSGLASKGNKVFAVHDSFYRESRFFELKDTQGVAEIRKETVLHDGTGVLLSALQDLKANLPGTDDFDPAALVNADGTVNLDLEGVETASGGDLWFAHEGAGNLVNGVSDPSNRPFESPDMLLRTDRQGEILEVVLLPLSVTQNQLRFGFEGVAKRGNHLYVAFQRAWGAAGDPSSMARIGRYDLQNGTWGFAHYPLTAPSSPNGGWVGLSELTHLGGHDFAVIERDNQGGADAAVKHVTTFSVAGVQFKDAADVASFDVLSKTLVVDLLATGAYDSNGGYIPEKLEGLTVRPNGEVWIVNDNDGVDDNSGETRLLRLDLGL